MASIVNPRDVECTISDLESDTTESEPSYMTPQTSNMSDYNTDDKLSPGLNSISISTPQTKKNLQNQENKSKSSTYKHSDQPAPLFPYGSNPLPLSQCRDIKRDRKQQKSKSAYSYATGSLEEESSRKKYYHLKNDEHLSFNSQYNKADSSTVFEYTTDQFDRRAQDVSDPRPFYPDLNSASWYQARCFDSYWRNYSFVSAWYQEHMNIVNRLTSSRQTV